MTTIASIRDSGFETSCDKCGNALIAPEWSEYVSDGLVLNFWSCTNCGFQFETEALMSATAESVMLR
jgi:ribosomal protein L37AE/L43A